MKKLFYIFFVIVLGTTACQNVDETSDNTDTQHAETEKSLPEMSIYHLPGVWTDQDSNNFELEELRGKVLVMVMIYTSCKAACPRLIADMRNIEEQVPDEYGGDVRYIMVSIDPETDSPSRMKSFAEENQMTDDRWMFIRSTLENTREFASVLAVNYKKISPIDFSHSNIISVFDREGEMVFQQEGLDATHTKTIQTIKELASTPNNRRG